MAEDLVALIRKERLQGPSDIAPASRSSVRISQLLRSPQRKRSPDIAGEIRRSRSQITRREGILITEIRRNNSGKRYQGTQQQNLQPTFPYWSLKYIQSAISNLGIKKGEPNLVEEIRKQQGNRRLYHVSSVQIEQPTYDSELVRKVRQDYIEKRSNPDDKLSIKDIDDHYKVVIVDKSVDIPLSVNSELIKIAKKLTVKCASDYEKARAIYDWIEDNIAYGDSKRNGVGYRDSVEVLETEEGVCGEMTFLYVTMARSVKLVSDVVKIGKDHACASVKTERGLIFVDPAKHMFDARYWWGVDHFDDNKAAKSFEQWRR